MISRKKKDLVDRNDKHEKNYDFCNGHNNITYFYV
jgi:hypothetical protein